MNKVQIKPTETGALISTYKNNPAYGYVTLQSEEMTTDTNGWIRNSVRTALLRAETALLEKFVAKFAKGGMLDGRIVVKEFVESELPENYASRLNKNVSYEDAIAPFIKRAGKDGVELTLGSKRILRFTEFDPTGNVKDVLIPNELILNELINTLTATQRMEKVFDDKKLKLFTYEDVSTFSKGTKPTKIIEDKSPSAITEKKIQNVINKKDRFFPEDMTLWEYIKVILTILLFIVGGIIMLGEAIGVIDAGSSNEWRRP